jgi:hypothetical protein
LSPAEHYLISIHPQISQIIADYLDIPDSLLVARYSLLVA